jgi:hypothetical protein
MKGKRRQVRPVPFDIPLKELARSKPSEVISRYSTSATNIGSTKGALGFPDRFGKLGLGTDDRIELFSDWLETVRDQHVPTWPM